MINNLNFCCAQTSPIDLLKTQNVQTQADHGPVYAYRPRQVTSQHPWQSQTEEMAVLHVPGCSMCHMEVHFGVASARGAVVVTGVQRADCREHNVSQIQTPPPCGTISSICFYLLPHKSLQFSKDRLLLKLKKHF